MPQGENPWVRDAVLGLVCLVVIGIFAWSAESGFLELADPRPQDAYYNLLVQGFQAGQLNVKREVPLGLTQLADPYDPALNASYVWDARYLSYEMSYYRGKLYLYFGVTPALVLFWPYAALTGRYLLQKDAVVVFDAVGFLIVAGLVRAVWRRYFAGTSVWIVAAGILALGLSAGMLEVLPRCDVYEVAISCGFALTMLALAAIWRAVHGARRRILWLVLASLAYGLAVGARPSLLFGAIILLVPVAQAWHTTTGPGSRRRAGCSLAAAVGPLMLIGLGLMLYNALRFGNPFEFGWHYQLTSCKQSIAQQFSLHYFWFNFRFYFLTPMHWTGDFPFLQAVQPSPLPPGYDGMGEPYSGILSNYPLAWLALAVPLAWRARPAEEAAILRWFVTAVFLLFAICALTLTLFFANSSCYESDFLPALMLLAVIGVFSLERALAGRPVWRRIARCGWCLLLVYTIGFNLLASIGAFATANYFAGNVFVNQRRLEQAIEHFQRGLKLEPESAALHYGLGNAYSREKRINEAIGEFEKALASNPDFAEAHNNLGSCLAQTGRLDEAIVHYRKAIELRPRFPQPYNHLGNAFRRKGRATEAVSFYQKAIEVQPDFIPAQINLAWMLATWPEPSVRNGSKAVALAEKANRLSNAQDPLVLRTLAAAYAETGRFPEAASAAKRALALAAAQSNTGLTHELQIEIGLYQTNSPCRTMND